jgi:hypothetical protein
MFFRNIDIVVRSRQPLMALTDALSKTCEILRHDRAEGITHVSFELRSSGLDRSPAKTAARLVRVVEALSPAARRCWDRAADRVFDFGFDGAADAAQGGVLIPAKTVAAIAAVGASICVTVYRDESDAD